MQRWIPEVETGDDTFNMMKTPMLYGIPNCDTVRKARKWLDSHKVAHDFVDLREATPSRERVSEWLSIVGNERLINRRSTTFKQLSDAERSALDQSGAVDILLAYPTLIKRPVLEWRDTVSVGFKTDEYAHYFGI